MPINLGEQDDELLWMADALEQGVVADKEWLPVQYIILTKNSKGFLIKCEKDGQAIYDYCWAKSATGKGLLALVNTPSEGDDQSVLCRCQSSVKNAVLKVVSEPGVVWVPADDEDERPQVMRVFIKPVEEDSPKSARKKSYSQPSLQQDNLAA